jgi:hypothetical protein
VGGAAAAASTSDGSRLQARLAGAAAWLDALYRFSRPHTMLGTAVSVCSVSALALAPGQLGGTALRAFLQALSSALLMNVCIVGINQVIGWLGVCKGKRRYAGWGAVNFVVVVCGGSNGHSYTRQIPGSKPVQAHSFLTIQLKAMRLITGPLSADATALATLADQAAATQLWLLPPPAPPFAPPHSHAAV